MVKLLGQPDNIVISTLIPLTPTEIAESLGNDRHSIVHRGVAEGVPTAPLLCNVPSHRGEGGAQRPALSCSRPS